MILLKTGILVVKVIRMVERISTKEPRYIQNSLDQKGSSSLLVGMFFPFLKYIHAPNPTKKKIKASSCPSIPLDVKACAELSAVSPLRVRNVEYNTITKDRA